MRLWYALPLGLLALPVGGSASPDQPAAAPAPPVLDMHRVKIVDLTHPFDERTLYWPNAPSAFALTRLHHGKTEAGFFYSANSFCAPEHGGTHMDAPIHFAEGGSSLDLVPVERLIAPGIVIDVRTQASADADYRLTMDDVRAWEKARGAIPAGSIVLLRTGWSQRWPDRKSYFGDDTPGDASKLHFPSYGKEAAQLLIGERKVAALGVDSASIDYGPSKDFVVHQIASAANVPGLENVARLEELPATGAWLVALPMKIARGSGGPLRIVALVPSR